MRLIQRLRQPRGPGRVAVIALHGPIGGGGRTADWVELARRLRENKRVAAVVIDIDSPGGSASASDNLYLSFARLSAVKPVVASISGAGASGAYLAALAARRIVAGPTSVVGSIGVISAGPRLPRLLDRLGVSVEEHTAGSLKGMGAPWREEAPAEAAKEQALVDAIYEAFVARVATARKLSTERARELATGEVWLGPESVELGLVDQVGDLEDAVEIAAKMAGVPAKPVAARLPRPLFGRLIDRFAMRVTRTLADEIEIRLSDHLRM
jgi:protease-4